MTDSERVLIEIVRVNTLEMAIQYVQYYVQRNGFLSNEAGDEVKRLLEEKNNAERAGAAGVRVSK